MDKNWLKKKISLSSNFYQILTTFDTNFDIYKGSDERVISQNKCQRFVPNLRKVVTNRENSNILYL